MDTLSFTVHVRDTSVKANRLRAQNLIPAEYYGHGVQNMSLQLNYQDFRRLYRKAGSNTVIRLDIEGKEAKNVLIHEVSTDPVTDLYTHVEFINVRMDEEVTTTIPVRLEGQAPAVKNLGGILLQNLDEIEVSCLPKDLIHELVIDVETLVDFNASIRVSDLPVPAGIKVLTDPEASIAAVVAPQEEVAEEEPVDVSSVEVTTEKKEEDGEGAGSKEG